MKPTSAAGEGTKVVDVDPAMAGGHLFGPLPEGWRTSKVKYLFQFVSGGTPPKDDLQFWGGDVPWVSPKDMKAEAIAETGDSLTRGAVAAGHTTMLPAGSLLLAVRSGILRHTIPVAINAVPVTVNQDLKGLLPRRSDLDVRYYAALIRGFQDLLLAAWRKLGATVESLETELISQTQLPVPSLPEQQAIAAFLDRETARVDALIGKKRRLIKLLCEKRQAVISHAVTKGLDPNGLMKNTGVEWMGMIPSHWSVVHLKRLWSTVDYGISDALDVSGEVAVLRMGNIQDGAVVFDDLKYVESVPDGLLLRQGDLLFNRTNSLDQVAKVGLYRPDGDDLVSFASYLVRLRTKQDVDPRYLAYLLNVPTLLDLARRMALPSIGQANLNPNRYGYIRVPVPPLVEQTAIVSHLDQDGETYERAVSSVTMAVARLQEHRAALTAAAVTGKIDVRACAQVPSAEAAE